MNYQQLKQLISGQKLKEFEQNIQKAVIIQTDFDLLLRQAIKNKCKNFYKYCSPLTRKGANVNFATGQVKLSNLMLACQQGSIQIVECLVSNEKIDLSLQDNRKQNALYYAISNKSKNQGQQALKLILEKNHGLINSLANNKTLLILAIEKGKLQIVRLLLQKGADPNHVIPDSGNTALHQIIKITQSKQTGVNKQIIKLLIQYGADLSIKNKTGKTAIQFAKKIRDQIIKYEQQIKNAKNKNISQLKTVEVEKKEIIYSTTSKQNLEKQSEIKVQIQKQSVQKKRQHSEINIYESQSQSNYSDQEQENYYENQEEQDESYLSKEQIANQLHKEINVFTDKCQTQYRQAQTDTLSFLQRFRQICRQFNLQVQIYGSFATGLWLKNCDIDILIIPNSQFSYEDERLNSNIKILAQVKKQLQKQRRIKNIIFTQKTKVPMLKLQIQVDYEYNTQGNFRTRKIDITVIDNNHNELQIVGFIQSNIKNIPLLTNLFYVIKSLTFHYKLNDPKNGGIRTYAIIIMILSFFQRFDFSQFHNLGQLLLRFLYFFGYEYQYQYGYEVQSFKYNVEQKNYNHFKQQNHEFGMLLTICDPLNVNNNIGKHAKAFSLQAMFKASYIALHANIDQRSSLKQDKTCSKKNIEKHEESLKRLNFMFDTKKIMAYI